MLCYTWIAYTRLVGRSVNTHSHSDPTSTYIYTIPLKWNHCFQDSWVHKRQTKRQKQRVKENTQPVQQICIKLEQSVKTLSCEPEFFFIFIFLLFVVVQSICLYFGGTFSTDEYQRDECIVPATKLNIHIHYCELDTIHARVFVWYPSTCW